MAVILVMVLVWARIAGTEALIGSGGALMEAATARAGQLKPVTATAARSRSGAGCSTTR